VRDGGEPRRALLRLQGVRLAHALLALLVCAACQTERPVVRTGEVDPARPCAFATTAEIAAAVGGEAERSRTVESRSKDGTLLCTYGVGRPFSTVTLHVDTGVSEDEFREVMGRDPINSDPLGGAGDLAFTHAGVNVSVWKDGRTASASVQHADDPDGTRAALENLAGLIASKL
jgi:hypothetical protein